MNYYYVMCLTQIFYKYELLTNLKIISAQNSQFQPYVPKRCQTEEWWVLYDCIYTFTPHKRSCMDLGSCV